MTNEAILLAAAGVPALAMVYFRINGALAFLSLCAGSVLYSFLRDDTGLIASSLPRSVSDSAIRIGLVLAPLALCMLFLRKSVGHSKLLLNIMPVVLAAVLGLLLVVPMLPGGVRYDMESTQAWRILSNTAELAVVAGVVTSLLFLLATTHEHSFGKRRKH